MGATPSPIFKWNNHVAKFRRAAYLYQWARHHDRERTSLGCSVRQACEPPGRRPWAASPGVPSHPSTVGVADQHQTCYPRMSAYQLSPAWHYMALSDSNWSLSHSTQPLSLYHSAMSANKGAMPDTTLIHPIQSMSNPTDTGVSIFHVDPGFLPVSEIWIKEKISNPCL